jgi:hypothetical protein
MTVYSIGVIIHATMYIKAENPEEAYAKARDMRDTVLELAEDDTTSPPISGKKYDDPDLPEISLSPAMTVADPEPMEFMEEADGE